MTEPATNAPVRRRPLPPFEQTLAGLAGTAPRSSVPFDATIGREELAMTLAASGLGVGETRASVSASASASASATTSAGVVFDLPTVSIDFSERRGPGPAAPTGPDLQVIGQLGEGGMGVVHLAEQRSLERTVAVKSTRGDALPGADAALCEEAVVTGRLEHPNVVPVHAFGRTMDGRPVMVMKRIEGVSWRTLLQDPAHAAWEAIGSGDRLVDNLQILTQVANALSFAHSKAVVHRDVKPENVMVGNFGEVLLVDFGLAVRLDRVDAESHAPQIVGTPAYMAPEMVAGMPVDARTDVYLLGATLHEILAGAPPHDGETLSEVLARAYASDPPEFDEAVPSELVDVCRRAMARYPEDRTHDARSFRADVQEYLTHRASHTLARRGEERLEEARDADDTAVRRAALTEARFACRQAIEQWPGNEPAREIERDATLAAVELELHERNVAGARALLATLADAPSALGERLAHLASEIDAERRGAERMRAMERDMDVSVGAGARRQAVTILGIFALCVSFYVMRRSMIAEFRVEDLLRVALVMFLFVTVGIAVFWKRIAANAIGRKLALVGWSMNVTMCVHRVIGAIAHERVQNILMGDSVLFTGMLVIVGIAIDLRLLIGVPFTLGGALGSAFFPEYAPQFFSGSTTLLLVAAGVYFQNLQRRADS